MCKPCTVDKYVAPADDIPIWMQPKDKQDAFIDQMMERLDSRFQVCLFLMQSMHAGNLIFFTGNQPPTGVN